jgi:hypothetical protein
MVLVAPAGACLKPFSGPVTCCDRTHSGLIRDMQRLRGKIYLQDGAIQPWQLTASGRHVAASDAASWHLLTVRSDGTILGCIRFLRHPNTVGTHQLNVSAAPLARSIDWAEGFMASLNSELEAARRFNFSYVEIGGWAIAQELRGSTEALHTVLSTFALSQLQGGALGVTTATERNGSASILRRLGGRPLEWDGAALPPYYDHTYGCGMEVLRFDSRKPSERYAPIVDALRGFMSTMPVFCPSGTPARDKSEGLFANLMPPFARQTAGLPAFS